MPLSTLDPSGHSPAPAERLPEVSKHELLITQSPDSSMWYADKIGQKVPYLGRWPEGFISREDAGYINLVLFADAEIIKIGDAA